MSWDMATKGFMGDLWPVPSGEIEVTLDAEACLEVALEAAEITVELSDG